MTEIIIGKEALILVKEAMLFLWLQRVLLLVLFQTLRWRGLSGLCFYSVSIIFFQLGTPELPLRRRQWQPTPVLLPGKSHGQRSLGGCSPWGHTVRHDWATSLSLLTFIHWRRNHPHDIPVPQQTQSAQSPVCLKSVIISNHLCQFYRQVTLSSSCYKWVRLWWFFTDEWMKIQ